MITPTRSENKLQDTPLLRCAHRTRSGASNVAARPQFSSTLGLTMVRGGIRATSATPSQIHLPLRYKQLHPQEQDTFSRVGLAASTPKPLLNQTARRPPLQAAHPKATYHHPRQLAHQAFPAHRNPTLPLISLLLRLPALLAMAIRMSLRGNKKRIHFASFHSL